MAGGKESRCFFGIFAGYYAVQLICGIFVFGIGTFLPDALKVMKYVGAAYITWLAIHIALSKPEEDVSDKSASFAKGFLLQFVNVKIYLFGITALTGYVTDYSTSFWVLLFFELVIATMGVLATTTWIGAGMLLQKFYEKHFRIINILLALTLAECVYSIFQ